MMLPMTTASRFQPYDRKKYLATVKTKDRPTAELLCDLLEEVYSPKEIQLYSGFPIVVRDSEWIAGFAMRAKCPMVYCCSPGTMKKMGKELAPLMSGKSCVEFRAKGGLSMDDVVALIRRAFREASKGPGSISKADMRKRDKARAAAAGATAKKKASKKKASKKAAKKKAASNKTRTVARKGATKKAAKKAAKTATKSTTPKRVAKKRAARRKA